MTYPVVRVVGLRGGARFRTGLGPYREDRSFVVDKPRLAEGLEAIPNRTFRQDETAPFDLSLLYTGGGLQFVATQLPLNSILHGDGKFYPDRSVLFEDLAVKYTVGNSLGSRNDDFKASVGKALVDASVTFDGVNYTTNIEPGQSMGVDADGDGVIDFDLTEQQTLDLVDAPIFALPPGILYPVPGELGNAVGQTARISSGVTLFANANPVLAWSATRLSDGAVLATEADGDYIDHAITAADQGQTIRIAATADDDGAGGPVTETRDVYILLDGEQPDIFDQVTDQTAILNGRGVNATWDFATYTIATTGTSATGTTRVQFLGLDPAKTYAFTSASTGNVEKWAQGNVQLPFDPVTGDCPPTQFTGTDRLEFEFNVDVPVTLTLVNPDLREVV